MTTTAYAWCFIAAVAAASVLMVFLAAVFARRPRPVSRNGARAVRETKRGGYPSGSRPVSELMNPNFRPRVATGLFRETTHECCPPVLTARGNFRFRCPVCHSEFDKATGEDWELARRHGVQWAAVDDYPEPAKYEPEATS